MATSLRLLTTRSAVVALTLIAIAVVWITAFQEVQFSRERELQEARKEAENYARAFEEHIARTIESVDAVVGRLAEPQPFADDRAELTPWAEATRRALEPYWKV